MPIDWTRRKYPEDGRHGSGNPFGVDRDRIIHCDTFRDLQHKTQVQTIVPRRERVRYRTRLNDAIEVAQIARGIAAGLNADEALTEAIALAHDLGHPPFGHAGERAISGTLQRLGHDGWNANVHSLKVVDRLECMFIDHRGLNLTLATREGIRATRRRSIVPRRTRSSGPHNPAWRHRSSTRPTSSPS